MACSAGNTTRLRPLGLLERWYSASFTHLSLENIAITASLSTPSPHILPSLAQLQAAATLFCLRVPLVTLSLDHHEPPHWVQCDCNTVQDYISSLDQSVVSVLPRISPSTYVDFLHEAHQPHGQPSLLLWKAVAFLPEARRTSSFEAEQTEKLARDSDHIHFEIVFLFNHALFDGKIACDVPCMKASAVIEQWKLMGMWSWCAQRHYFCML